jgi:CRP-like cAMP-binding protein
VSSGGAALGELGRGDLFGEIAIVERRRRSATVTATAPVKVLMMFGWDFRGLQEAQPEIAARIADAMAQRLAADAGPA